MAWLRDRWNWLVVPNAPDADPVTTADPPDEDGFARPANWNDVFALVRLLERHAVEYTLVGGYALSFNGLARQTGDVDVLVRNSRDNNRRWVAALCELPAGKARELLRDRDDPFTAAAASPGGPDCDEEPGTIKVADVFVVDVLPRACGLTFEDLQPHIRRVPRDGFSMNVLDLVGLRLTKQAIRPKDRSDLLHIEAALRALGNDLDWVAGTMNRRRIAEEAPPGTTISDFRMPDDTDVGIELAEAVIVRTVGAGGQPDLDAGTLALYADEDTLRAILALPEPTTDIHEQLRHHGIEIPGHGI